MEKPEETFRAGGVHASVFLNTVNVKGKKVDIPSISFQKRYQVNGEWKTTTSLNVNDLPRAVLVLMKAYEYCLGMSHEEIPEEEVHE